jgi:PTH1 family peptidyl-tRNA hydrolase
VVVAVKLIVGLGNPGPRYVGTRHNVGFAAVDLIAQRAGIVVNQEKFHGWFGKGTWCDCEVLLLKPMTFMNRSGRAVQATGRFFKLDVSDLLVLTDDTALPVGRIRIRERGSSGGHNGLQDIIDRLGTNEWCRLRIGVGQPIGDSASYVLGRMSEGDAADTHAALDRTVDAVACWLKEGAPKAMSLYNVDPAGGS